MTIETENDMSDENADNPAAVDDSKNASGDVHAGEEGTTADDSGAEKDDDESSAIRRGLRRWLAPAVLAVLLIASASVASWLYFIQYRTDQQVDADAQQAVLGAAADGTVALLSYAPDSLDADFTNAKSRLTGDFLSYYTQFTDQIVTPAAKQKQVTTSAAVIQKAVAEMHPESAVVLVFLNQTTTSKENPDGAFSASAVKVGLQKTNGNWLISSFDPI